jgi:hemolysin activation/secretion protein
MLIRISDHRRIGVNTLALAPGAAPRIVVLLIACGLPALAAAQSTAPGAGSLLKELTPVTREAQQPPTVRMPDVPRAVTAPLTGGPKLRVAGFRLSGIDQVRHAALLAPLTKYVGADKTLGDLQDAAKDVEVALQRQGLFLAQVYIPEQTLQDDIVELRVIEGRIGDVKLEVDPGVRVDPALMDRFIEDLRGHPLAERERVERALFALGDLRSVVITSSLTPGQRVGYADLTVKVTPGKAAQFGADFDNGGSIFTGRYRLGASAEWLSPTGRGDSLSLKALVSTTGDVAFARAAWLMPIGARGTKLGLAASALRYRLGTPPFEPLDASGTGEALTLQLLHPVLRSRNQNLFLQGSFDRRSFDDKVAAINLDSRKRATSYFTVGAVGDFRDTWGGGAISNYSINFIGGKLELRTPADIATDAANYHAAGNYGKLVVTASRLQSLPNKDYLYLSATAQYASKDLDSSEKQSLGGPNGVRGYPAPDTPSDSALIAGWEYRRQLPITIYPGDWVLAVFGDYGVGRQHESPLPTDTDNVRRLLSHGIGLTYANYEGLTVKGLIAVRGPTQAQSDDSRARAYMQLSKQF